jgi:protoporphyrinogen oxidase
MVMKVKNLIIGAGFAGLTAGYYADDALIIEASPYLGGLLRGFKSPSGDYTFDVGGHVYTTKDAELSFLLKNADAKFFGERKAYFDYKHKYGYPIQYDDNVGIPIFTSEKDGVSKNLERLLIKEFGHEFYESILRPFNKRVWSTEPDKMDIDWIVGRVPLMQNKSRNWGPNGSFYYAKGEDILEAVLERCASFDVRVFTNTWATIFDYEAKRVYVNCEAPAVYKGWIEYENLFDTTGKVLESKVKLPHNNILTVGIGLKRRIKEDFHWWYNGTDNQSPVHRITLLSRYHDGMAPKGSDSLLIEMPQKAITSQPTIETSSNKAMGASIVALLRAANFDLISPEDVTEVMSIYSKGYPIPVVGHRAKVAYARKQFMEKNVYLIGRWGAHGYYNLDHIMKDVGAANLASMGAGDNEDYFWANYYYEEKRRF